MLSLVSVGSLTHYGDISTATPDTQSSILATVPFNGDVAAETPSDNGAIVGELMHSGDISLTLPNINSIMSAEKEVCPPMIVDIAVVDCSLIETSTPT